MQPHRGGTPDGDRFVSLIHTCRLAGVKSLGYLTWLFKNTPVLRAPVKNKSTTLLVFLPVSGVTSADTYPDMRRGMCLGDEPEYGAILWIY
jgi:hypothetical protein